MTISVYINKLQRLKYSNNIQACTKIKNYTGLQKQEHLKEAISISGVVQINLLNEFL